MCRAARWQPTMTPKTLTRHHRVEVVEVVVEEATSATADAGVVAHDVQPAEPLDGEVDRGLHLVGVGDVGLLERGGVAELGGQRSRRVRRRRRR